MQIVISSKNYDLINTMIALGKEKGFVVINAKQETVLFNTIETDTVSGYIIEESSFSEKAINFIKKRCPYIPIVLIQTPKPVFTATVADFIIADCASNLEWFCKSCVYALRTYAKNFEVLKKLTTKMASIIEFGNCSYDPTRRLLYVKDKEMKKLSAKEGGVLEVLATNYGQVVTKDVIMEKVWRKSDYFVSRSLDVYVTHLRNILKDAKIKMNIKNISNVGLILECA